jgi:hypothetical protein
LFKYDASVKKTAFLSYREYLYTINYIDVYHRVLVDKYLQDFPASFSLFVSSLKLTSKVRKKEKKYKRTGGTVGGEKGEASFEETSPCGSSPTLQLLRI